VIWPDKCADAVRWPIQNPELLEGGGRVKQASKRQFSLLTLLDALGFTCSATGDPQSGSALQPESGGSRGNAGSHPFPRRQLTQRREEARTQRAGRWGGKGGFELLTQRVKLPTNRNPCVMVPLRHCVDSITLRSLEWRIPDGR
jgi:hypothetical protein